MKMDLKKYAMQLALLVKVVIGMNFYAKIKGLSFMTWAEVGQITKLGFFISFLFWIYALFGPTQTE